MHLRILSILCFALLSFSVLSQPCLFTEVTIQTVTGDWGEELSWTLLNETGGTEASFQAQTSWTTYDTLLCLPDGCYTIKAEDSYGDGWNGGHLLITFGGENLDYALESGNLGYFYFGVNATGCEPAIPGCTDPASLNFNPLATVDDGSCMSMQEVIDVQMIDTILWSGPKDNRINWVIQNRSIPNPNNNFANQAEFVQMYEDDLYRAFTLGDSLAQAPYAQYRNFFNLYAAWWPDAPSDQTWWSFNIIQSMRDSLFLPWENEETGWVTWFSTTKYGGGGGSGLNREKRVGDGKMYGMGWETFLHEFGHTMPGLPDEYTASGEWSGGNCWESGNTTGFTVVDEIPWRLWIEPGTPLPTPYTEQYLNKIGAFEGALTNYFGCFRPTARGCYMGAGGFGEGYGQELCPPCVQRVICYLYKYVNVIEDFSPAQTELEVTGAETIHFSAEVLKPDPNTQLYQWILNGKVIATGVEEIDLTFGPCDTYELVFAVTDTNSLVRFDPKFAETYPKPYREVRWTIDQTDVSSYGLAVDYTLQDPDCTGLPNGNINPAISGGQPPYEIFINNAPFPGPLTNLAAGEYALDIVDDNGCGLQIEATLEQTPLLLPQICSEYTGGVWTLSLQTQPYDLNNLTFQWSTGQQTASISGLQDGTYWVEVTTPAGCSVVQSISLSAVQNELQVQPTVFNSETTRFTGRIYLDIEGGLPPYSITWADRPYRDLTDTTTANIQASGTTWGHLPKYAFDNDLNTKWLHFVSQNAWISYKNLSGSTLYAYAITSGDDVPERDPKNWMVQGSNNGTNWTTLDQRSGQDFSKRREKRIFALSEPAAFSQYRLYITQNHGDGSIQLQELEFIGSLSSDLFSGNEDVQDQSARLELAPGEYIFTVKDANQMAVTDTVAIGMVEPFIAAGLKVVPDGICGVKVEDPDPGYDYFWFPDDAGSAILSTGTTFRPDASGNYYVGASNPAEAALSADRKGFAVTLPPVPQLELTPDTLLTVVDPDPELEYYWYDQASCGTPLDTGVAFVPPAGAGIYYASAYRPLNLPDPIDPATLSGLLLHMDAADLDGDGQVDDPQAPTSSTLDWAFPGGNGWGSWFAYRSNYQNGLGVADFATLWLQNIQQSVSGFQTILMAYRENPISFPGTAPFEALSPHIPKNEDASQLFPDNTPSTTLNGTTMLNGTAVDPLVTPNPLEFCILGVKMTQPANNSIFYTDTHWEGQLGELLLWDHPLSDAELAGASEYLRKKWISTADLESPRASIFWEFGPSSVQDQPPTFLSIRAFPNPVGRQFQVEGLEEGFTLRIISSNGALLANIACGAETVVIDMQQAPPGIFFLQVIDREGRIVGVEKMVAYSENQ
ncbi:MAG: discoidin domain-containing protein [Lewinellaceae bacterium]|nr:discoidin domain-containing protein [Lewinellaceae bacterium]